MVAATEMGTYQIANKIRELRFHHQQMTQQELADKVDVTRQTIIAIEKGNYSPSLELAFRIARVFEVPLTEIFAYLPSDKENN